MSSLIKKTTHVDFIVRIQQLFRAKLGLLGEEEDDGDLAALLLKARRTFQWLQASHSSRLTELLYSTSAVCLVTQMMEDTQSDFTMTFRQLSELSAQQLQKKDFEQVEPIRFSSFFSPELHCSLRQWDNNQECLWDGKSAGQ